jgi:hypothetical protein
MDASKVSSSQRAQTVEQTKRTDEARQARQQQAKAEQAESKKSPYENPKPTTNGQGQTIGTRLSVTA